MSIVLITGSCGLIGQEACHFFYEKGLRIVGIDNHMRKFFFGNEANTQIVLKEIKNAIPTYEHHDQDIRDYVGLEKIFSKYENEIAVIIHTAAQPSHDWSAKDPMLDFNINANGTLNLLELTRKVSKDAVFIFVSTNKVYGDTPNKLPLIEKDMRYEIAKDHKFYQNGINESMSIDNSMHSLFGASKSSADLLVQEYGRYFGLKTVCFRAGCLTGSKHMGAKLHGFLSYLIKCQINNYLYSIIGYKGKQVRDNIHSFDLVNAFWHFFQNPKVAMVYNIGGGRKNSVSILEAIFNVEKLSKKTMKKEFVNTNRKGDHIWWISDFAKFKSDYPTWSLKYDLDEIILEILEEQKIRTMK